MKLSGREEKTPNDHCKNQNTEKIRNDAPNAFGIKVAEMDGSRLLQLTEKNAGNEITRDDEKNVHADETAGKQIGPSVKKQNGQHGQSAQPGDV